LKELKDTFSINLAEKELYSDLKDYLFQISFNSPDFKNKVINLIRKFVKERWTKEMNKAQNSSFQNSKIPSLENILLQVSTNVGN